VPQPDSGHAAVCGHDVVSHAHRVRQLTGLTGQYTSVDETLTGLETQILVGRLTSQSRAESPARLWIVRFRDIRVGGRGLVQIKHNPTEAIDFSVQPVMFLLLDTYVFGGSIGARRRRVCCSHCRASACRTPCSPR
jgi:hypothetical protein